MKIVHWPPFLKAGVEYVRDSYTDPKTSEKAQALIAFLFAVSGHQVQDAAWHSIGLLMGFIDEVAKVECKGSTSSAHETLDWGGDAIFGKRYSGQKGEGDWAYVCTFSCSSLMLGGLVCSCGRHCRDIQTTEPVIIDLANEVLHC